MLLHRVVVALALPLALTACGGDPIAPPPLTPVTSTTTSPTPTEEPETAEEFIRRWQAEADKMQNTGDTTAYLSLSQGCGPCADFAQMVRRIYGDGGYIKYGGTTVVSVERRPGNAFDYQVVTGPTEYRETASGSVKRLEGGTSKLGVELARVADEWRVTDSYSRPDSMS